jgi:hypothetical protein
MDQDQIKQRVEQELTQTLKTTLAKINEETGLDIDADVAFKIVLRTSCVNSIAVQLHVSTTSQTPLPSNGETIGC